VSLAVGFWLLDVRWRGIHDIDLDLDIGLDLDIDIDLDLG